MISICVTLAALWRLADPDAVASRVAATDDEDFLAFAVDDVFRRDDDAFEDTVLL